MDQEHFEITAHEITMRSTKISEIALFIIIPFLSLILFNIIISANFKKIKCFCTAILTKRRLFCIIYK